MDAYQVVQPVTHVPRASEVDSVITGTDGLQWFAVYTSPCHEKRVAEHFAYRNIESYLPLFRSVRKWRNRTQVELQRPLFPSYVFVRIAWPERSRVLAVPGALSFVGCGSTPSPLPDFEVETLRSELHLRKFEPYPHLAQGTRVRITRGPLMGMEGVLQRQKSDMRVVLTLDLIMQSVAVEVDGDDVAPANCVFRN